MINQATSVPHQLPTGYQELAEDSGKRRGEGVCFMVNMVSIHSFELGDEKGHLGVGTWL